MYDKIFYFLKLLKSNLVVFLKSHGDFFSLRENRNVLTRQKGDAIHVKSRRNLQVYVCVHLFQKKIIYVFIRFPKFSAKVKKIVLKQKTKYLESGHKSSNLYTLNSLLKNHGQSLFIIVV